MLSDSLFEARQNILDNVKHYSLEPFERNYPESQKKYIVMALYYLDLARIAYDSCDNHTLTEKEKQKVLKKANNDFDKTFR